MPAGPEAHPVVEMRRQRHLANARLAIARLEEDPADPTGRGALGEALSRLGSDPPDWLVDAYERFQVPRPQLPVKTERLVLRVPVPGDAPDMVAYYGREDVVRYMLPPPYTLAEMEFELERRTSSPDLSHLLPLVMELDGRVVGDMVLAVNRPACSQAELGWAINPEFGGAGLATEAVRALLALAFDHYGLHRVSAELDGRNARSAALAERVGMRREAVRRRDSWAKGAWTDTWQYALLAEEYRAGAGSGS